MIICEATMWLTQIVPRLPNFQAHLLIHHIQMDGLHHLHTRSIRTQKKPAPSLHENCLKTVSKAILSSRLNHRSPLMFLNADDYHVPIIITITIVIRTACTTCQFPYYKNPEMHNYLHYECTKKILSEVNSFAQDLVSSKLQSQDSNGIVQPHSSALPAIPCSSPAVGALDFILSKFFPVLL